MTTTNEQMRDLLDSDGENRAVRTFLGAYQCSPDMSVKSMKIHLEHSGFNDCWPAWVIDPANAGHLTKGGAQSWIRHLFSLESASLRESAPAPQELTDDRICELYRDSFNAMVGRLREAPKFVPPAVLAFARSIEQELLSRSTAPQPETERDKLRAMQAKAVMPLIGSLLDAYEGTPNDMRGELTESYTELDSVLRKINTAMETVGEDFVAPQPEAVAIDDLKHQSAELVKAK